MPSGSRPKGKSLWPSAVTLTSDWRRQVPTRSLAVWALATGTAIPKHATATKMGKTRYFIAFLASTSSTVSDQPRYPSTLAVGPLLEHLILSSRSSLFSQMRPDGQREPKNELSTSNAV